MIGVLSTCTRHGRMRIFDESVNVCTSSSFCNIYCMIAILHNTRSSNPYTGNLKASLVNSRFSPIYQITNERLQRIGELSRHQDHPAMVTALDFLASAHARRRPGPQLRKRARQVEKVLLRRGAHE